MGLGKRLISLRKEHHLTREQFADILGMSKYTLRNYELDVHEPDSDFLKMISDYFNVSIDYIIGVTEEREQVSKYQLKESERHLIEKYRLLSPQVQRTISRLIDLEIQEMQDDPS